MRTATVREVALELYRQGDAVFGLQRWQAFLIAAGKALRATSRWVPATAVSDFEGELGELAAAPAPAPVREALLRLRRRRGTGESGATVAGGRLPPAASARAAAAGADALRARLGSAHRDSRRGARRAVGADAVAGQRRSPTGWTGAHPGHVLDLRRVDSRDDPRVQIADLVAGIARRAAASLLIGRPDRRLIDLVTPMVDPRSVWPDETWRDGLSRGRRPAWPRGGTDRPCARPA